MNQRTQEAIRQIYHIFSGADACNKTTQENGRRKRVLFFSSYESVENIARQLLAHASGAAPDEVDNEPLSPGVEIALKEVSTWDLLINATPNPKLKNILSGIQEAFLEGPVDAIIFDGPGAVRNGKEKKNVQRRKSGKIAKERRARKNH